MTTRHRSGALAILSALVMLGWGAPALGEPTPQPLVLAQADADPMAEGSVEIRREAGEDVGADVRFEIGADQDSEQPPVSAAPGSDGVPVLWVVLGLGALMLVLLIVLLARSSGGRTTVVRD